MAVQNLARQDEAVLDIPVGGMTCASCVGRVERAIRSVEGVAAASVNLATERARVRLGPGAEAAKVAEAIRDVGYEPAERTVSLRISGMTCASCVGRVERALRAVPGVVDAVVNLATGRATVRALGDVTGALVRAVAEAGYEAEPAQTGADGTDRERAARAAELAALRRSVILAAGATVPLLVFEMGAHLSDTIHGALHAWIGLEAVRVLSFLLATFVLFGPGLRFHRKGWPALWRRAPDMNSLVALGTSAAYGYSVVATFAPGLLPAGNAYTYYEAGAVIVTLILLGRLFEARARGRTSEAIRRLMTLQAKTARVVRDGRERYHPLHPVEQRERRAFLRFDVDGREAVDRIADHRCVEPCRVGSRKAAVAIAGPLHRRSDAVAIAEVDVVAHTDLVAVVDHRRSGKREEQAGHQLDPPPAVLHQRRQTAPDAVVDPHLWIGGVGLVHVVAFLVGHHLERQLVVVAKEQSPLAALRNFRRLTQDLDNRVTILLPHGHEHPRHQRKIERHVALIAIAEVRV